MRDRVQAHAFTLRRRYPHGHGTHLDKDQDMSTDERRLARHITWAIVVKLAVLATLWWLFVRNDQVSVDASTAAAHLRAPAAPHGTTP